jgi:hypothetical protein
MTLVAATLPVANTPKLCERRRKLGFMVHYGLLSRRMRCAGHVARIGERRDKYRVLVGKPEGKRPLGTPRHRWEDNIKLDLQEVGCGSMDWINLAPDTDRWRALVNAAMKLGVP